MGQKHTIYMAGLAGKMDLAPEKGVYYVVWNTKPEEWHVYWNGPDWAQACAAMSVCARAYPKAYVRVVIEQSSVDPTGDEELR